jgi:hypothetical protein
VLIRGQEFWLRLRRSAIFAFSAVHFEIGAAAALLGELNVES